MSNPTKYIVSFDFSDAQAVAPTSPSSPTQLDVQFGEIALSIGQTIDALEDVRRSDGALQNGIVTKDSLAPEVIGELVSTTAALTAQAVAANNGAQSAAVSAAAAADTAASAANTLQAVADLARNFYTDWGDWHSQPTSTTDWGSFH